MNEPIIRTGRDRVVGSKIALRAFLAAVGVSAVFGLLVILDVLSDTRFVMTGGVIAAGCLATLVAALVADHGRFQRWMHAAMWVTWLAGLVWLSIVWFEPAMGSFLMERVARSAGALTAFSAWSIFSGVTLAPRTGGASTRAVRLGTFAVFTAWAAFGEFALANPEAAEGFIQNTIGSQWFGRILAASVVVVAAGTVAQPVLIRLVRTPESEGAIRGRHAHVALSCPRCGAACGIEANTEAACPACRLAIRVEVAEPRCACGYLLHGIEGASCPECGAAIPESLRWRAPVSPAPSR